MQIPIQFNAVSETFDEFGSQSPAEQPGWLLTLESQLNLRSLYGYIDNSRKILSEIEELLSTVVSSTGGLPSSNKAVEKLEVFCLEADSWGFNNLFDVAQSLQYLLRNSDTRVRSEGFREALNRGVAMLSALLTQCESEFCWRLAKADTLEYISQAGATM
jgi:hypothetical protein